MWFNFSICSYFNYSYFLRIKLILKIDESNLDPNDRLSAVKNIYIFRLSGEFPQKFRNFSDKKIMGFIFIYFDRKVVKFGEFLIISAEVYQRYKGFLDQ